MKRASALVLLVLLVLLGCGEAAPSRGSGDLEFAERFLSDRAFRRESLERAVESPNNDYSALRLAEYATSAGAVPTGWDALDVWNPEVRPLTIEEPGRVASPSSNAPVWDGKMPVSDAEWLALGRRAFELWPVEIDDRAGSLAADAALRKEFGMWTDDRQRVAGLVHVLTADGADHVAWSCSGCHARPDADGRLIHGPAAVTLDRGAMSPALPDGSPSPAWAWGKGRLDVTADGLENPTAIPDLRAASHQSHLHWEATLANSLPALAIRIETLIIDNAHQELRPPRELSVALALYVTSLGAAGGPGDRAAAPEGAQVFDQQCANCHHADGSSAPPIPTEVIGTDRRAADSPARGTGRYRVPSLWAVADRGQLLHDGAVPDLQALLDPQRLDTIPGHRFGLDLSTGERRALIAFLATIGR
jgi:mono/diheme cytochrome c family protein